MYPHVFKIIFQITFSYSHGRMKARIMAEMSHTKYRGRQKRSPRLDSSAYWHISSFAYFIEYPSLCWPGIYDECIMLYICLKSTWLWSQNTPVPARFLQVNVFCLGKWPHLHWLSMSSCRQTPGANHLQIPALGHRCAIRQPVHSVYSVYSHMLSIT